LNFIEPGNQPVERHNDSAVVDLLAHLLFDFGLELSCQRRKIDQPFHESTFEKRLFLNDLLHRVRYCKHIGM